MYHDNLKGEQKKQEKKALIVSFRASSLDFILDIFLTKKQHVMQTHKSKRQIAWAF